MISITEWISDKTVSAITKNSTLPNSPKVLRYALLGILNYLVTIIIVLIVSALTGKVISAVVAIVCFPILRNLSGGLHLRSSATCSVLTALFILIAVHNDLDYWYNGLILNLLALYTLTLRAPSGIEGFSTLNPKYYVALKLLSILFATIAIPLQSTLLASLFFLQSLTLLKTSQRIVDYYKL